MAEECGKCWKCVEGRGCVKGVQVDPRATPSRTRRGVPRTPNPAWERGVPTDNRGMPYLRPDLSPMGVKEFSGKRSKFEDRRKVKATSTTT